MPIRSVTVSAPSKVILHGEHAVVYGKTALAASLNLRTSMRLTILDESEDHTVSLNFPDVGVNQSWKLSEVSTLLKKRPTGNSPTANFQIESIDENFLNSIKDFLSSSHYAADVSLKSASLLCFFYMYALLCRKAIPVKITVNSEIPIGAGLGSSAALSVCLAAGLLAIQGEKTQKDLICKLAFVSEKILHGNPSGIDNSVSTYGGLVEFSNFKLSVIDKAPPLKILLVNTQVTRNTKSLVEKVAKQYKDHTEIIKPILEAIDGISRTCLTTLELMEKGKTSVQASYDQLQTLIDYNQKLLETLLVSHPKIDEVVRISTSLGLHAKLTGAGGGGFAFVLLPPTAKVEVIELAKELLTKQGMHCCETALGVEGVTLDFDQ